MLKGYDYSYFTLVINVLKLGGKLAGDLKTELDIICHFLVLISHRRKIWVVLFYNKEAGLEVVQIIKKNCTESPEKHKNKKIVLCRICPVKNQFY